MQIFQGRSTPQSAGWIKSLQDAKMASISNGNALAMAARPLLRAFPSDLFAILAPQGRC
jgi:hypothetical protein